jgi:hypothetical protein
MGAENLESTEIRSPDRPARSSRYISFAMPIRKHVKKTQEVFIPFPYTNNPTQPGPFLFFDHFIYFAKKRLLIVGSACVDVG